MLVDHLPLAIAPRPDPRAAHPGGLQLAFGVGSATMGKHAAAGQLAADIHMQFMGLEETFALTELEAALPVRPVFLNALELQCADRIEGDYVIGVLRHDPVEIFGLGGLFKRFVQLANGALDLAVLGIHVLLL